VFILTKVTTPARAIRIALTEQNLRRPPWSTPPLVLAGLRAGSLLAARGKLVSALGS
jgi:hypothetical protein